MFKFISDFIPLGFAFGLGMALAILLSILVLQFVGDVFSYGKDNSDPDHGRSGLRIYTDSKTGVQYVGNGNGNGITVHIDANGNPVVYSSEE